MSDMIINPIVVAGSGRSGTTWILDSIAEANNLMPIFEPLHPIGVPYVAPYAHRYIRDDEHVPGLKFYMDRLFSGKQRSLWINYRVRPDRLRLKYARATCFNIVNRPFQQYRKLLSQYMRLLRHIIKFTRHKPDGFIIKFIRANLMLGWISKNYDAKILLIVRHPAAVVSSRLELINSSPLNDWGFEELLKQYGSDEKLYKDYLYRYGDIMHSRLNSIEVLTVLWCIENLLPIERAKKLGHCVVFYEDLIQEPDKQWKQIAQSLSLRVMPASEIYTQPSQQTWIHIDKGVFHKRQLSKWMKHLSKNQLCDIDKILNVFNTTIYNVSHPMPIKSN